ncbi:hypothetical protein FRB94_009392 [Tulasnella sp. JGI-2019a]|nr:hypothetical protein FRB94_009392 [Tulasnella sp. JGI-2019a]
MIMAVDEVVEKGVADTMTAIDARGAHRADEMIETGTVIVIVEANENEIGSGTNETVISGDETIENEIEVDEDEIAATSRGEAQRASPTHRSEKGDFSKAPPPARDATVSQMFDIEPEDGEDVEDTDTSMMAAMGFGGFGTTKDKPVDGNQEGAAFIKKQRTWRQYMNRKGGFNRPLDKIK